METHKELFDCTLLFTFSSGKRSYWGRVLNVRYLIFIWHTFLRSRESEKLVFRKWCIFAKKSQEAKTLHFVLVWNHHWIWSDFAFNKTLLFFRLTRKWLRYPLNVVHSLQLMSIYIYLEHFSWKNRLRIPFWGRRRVFPLRLDISVKCSVQWVTKIQNLKKILYLYYFIK